MTRRDLIKTSAVALAATQLPALGTGAEVPKKRAGLRSLLKSGDKEVFSGEELRFIGMPIGGFFAGTLYLGGDGQLWNWDVFNQERLGCVERQTTVFMGDTLNAMGGANYVDPVRQQSPFNQRFALLVEDNGTRLVRFGDVRFRGEYPIGRVAYREADAEIEMDLEAFSPFCPLDVDRSSYPATTMTYRLRNTGKTAIKLALEYRTDNPVMVHSRASRADYRLTGKELAGKGASFSAEPLPPSQNVRKDILFEDWSSGSYGQWTATGTSFGDRPQKVSELPTYMGPVQAGTEYVVNAHQTRNGEDVGQADEHTGKLRSPDFTIERRSIALRVGGGSHKGQTCVNLVVDGNIVRTVTGHDTNAMAWETFDVRDLEGKKAYLEVVDTWTGGWGQISLGEVIFTDTPKFTKPLAEVADYGTFAVTVVGGANRIEAVANGGVVGRRLTLEPGQTQEVTFIVAWHFPNCAPGLPGKTNWYAGRWSDAEAVAADLEAHWPELQKVTREWNATWYDSTLPSWFLDRTFVNTSILATTTCHRLDKGRFYFSEGVGCCPGTCTHVWGYAQAIGRLFPEIERYLRREIDFGMAYHADTGAIDYRAEFHQVVATDGQASCILRAYREHQMSPDSRFLRSIWPQVKGSLKYLINQDVNQDGILDGAQYNTLDTAWFGEIAWISSLYIAALRAGEAMAKTLGDDAFAVQCASLAAKGSQRLVKDLFNGEYFVNRADDAHPEANNTRQGCHIDQVYGQAWAMQVGLPRVVPNKESVAALKSLYRYSFYDDVWEYRRQNRAIPGGRWYATPKEGGLIMCSFPKGGAAESIGKSGDAWAVGYFNECMSGFEYQVAAHMIAEGLVEEGMTLVKAIHDRYHPSKRNPYNEIECSDHYGRAMASYGAFVSIAGFQNDGPNHRMSHSPKVGGNFRCAFVNEQGWGTYRRTSDGEKIEYRYRVGAG